MATPSCGFKVSCSQIPCRAFAGIRTHDRLVESPTSDYGTMMILALRALLTSQLRAMAAPMDIIKISKIMIIINIKFYGTLQIIMNLNILLF
jgi:hypothetical protein